MLGSLPVHSISSYITMNIPGGDGDFLLINFLLIDLLAVIYAHIHVAVNSVTKMRDGSS